MKTQKQSKDGVVFMKKTLVCIGIAAMLICFKLTIRSKKMK